VLIIFNQDGYRDNDLNAVVQQHKSFRNAILAWVGSNIAPSADELRQGMEDHLLQIARRSIQPPKEARRAKPLPVAL
jgi:hypothetical protein